jgi:hypothetical protein
MRRAAAAMLLLVACSTSTSPTASPTVSPSSVTTPPEASSAIDAALSDAASHLGVNREQLAVVQVQPRQWPDSSLGCPQPGQLYSQVVTPGYLVVISTAGKQLEYHTDERARVMLCRES